MYDSFAVEGARRLNSASKKRRQSAAGTAGSSGRKCNRDEAFNKGVHRTRDLQYALAIMAKKTPESMMKVLPVNEYSSADIIKLIRCNYITRQAETPKDKVKSRNMDQFGYMTDTSHLDGQKVWTEKYTHKKQMLQSGLHTENYVPYRDLGDITLEPNELLIKNFGTTLPKWMQDMKCSPRGDTLARKEPKEEEDKPKSERSVMNEIRARNKKCHSSGYSAIKGQLKESEDRIKATRARQPYLAHVAQCQAERDAFRLQKQGDQTVRMVVSQMSENTLDLLIHTSGDRLSSKATKDMEDGQKKEDKEGGGEQNTEQPQFGLHGATVKLTAAIRMKGYRTNKKISQLVQKLDFIYMALCSLHNFKSRYLKARNTLSLEIVKGLRRDPFARKDDDELLKSRFSRNQRCMSTDTLSSRYDMSSHMRSSRQGSIVAASHGSTRSGNMKPMASVNRRKTRLFNFFGGVTTANKDVDTGPARLETWEDLVSLGVKTRLLRILRRAPLPWQQPIPTHETVKTAAAETEGEAEDPAKPLYDPYQCVPHITHEFVTLKERMQKRTQLELDKVSRERTLQFRNKIASMSRVPPMLVDHLHMMGALSRETARDPELITEDTAPWYEALVQEATQMNIRHDEKVVNSLSKLYKFILDDITLVPNVRFILEMMLESNGELLSDWLQHRKLYMIENI